MSISHRIMLSLIAGLMSLLLFTTVALADTVVTDDNGITGFERYGNGLYWWSADGECTGEFPHNSTIRLRGQIDAETKSLANSCTILEDSYDNAVRDDAYIYFFDARQLQRKALNANEQEPSQAISSAQPLPAGQSSAVLALAEGQLFWPNFDTQTGKSTIQRMPADGSAAPQLVTSLTGELGMLVWKRYTDSNSQSVDALVILTKEGQLFRYKLNQPGSPALLASGIVDFALHDQYSLFSPAITSIYAAQSAANVLPNSPPGKLLQINIASGATTTVYTAAGKNQVTAVGTDSALGAIVLQDAPAKNVYIAEAGITCGDILCTPGNTSIKRHALPAAADNGWKLIVADGVGGNLRSDDQWLYYINDQPNNHIEKIATDAPPLELDFQADKVEVVQTTQSLAMDVQLVAGKPTFARGYAHLAKNTTGKAVWFPRAVLRGFLDGKELPGSPLEALNNVGLDTSTNMMAQRSSLQKSFLFKLPDSWVAKSGALGVQLVIDPDHGMPETAAQNNNTVGLPQAVMLNAKQNVCLDTVRMKTANTIPADPDKMTEMVARTRSLLPVRNVAVFVSNAVIAKPVFHIDIECWLIFCAPVPYFTDEAFDMSEDKSAAMAWLTIFDTLTTDFNSCDDSHLVGMVDPSEDGFNGQGLTSFSNDVLVRMEPSANGAPAFNAPYGGRTLAHELSHNYGREHIDQTTSALSCGSTQPAGPYDAYPNDSCTIGSPGDPTTWFGFDPITRRLITPTIAGDLMSYATARWTSQFTWDADFQATPAGESVAAASLQGQNGPMLLVSGLVSPTQNSGQFAAFYLLPEGVAPQSKVAQSLLLSAQASAADAYLIRLVGEGGATLAEHPVVLAPNHDDAGPVMSFAQYVPFDPQTQRIQLVQGATILDERQVSAHAPTLTLQAPVVDEATHTLSLAWLSGDPDNTLASFTDLLLFTVQYSADDGATWHNILANYPWLAATLDTQMLPGSAQARVRVLATDGVNTTIATSERFALAKHAPAPQIGGVGEGARLNFGEIVSLQGLGLDAEEGTLPSDHLMWSISGPSAQTGSGDLLLLTDLAPGVYTATLSATDGDNQTGTANRHFEVLPVTPPTISAPALDGVCGDGSYADATLVHIPLENGGSARAWLLHADGKLYACFADLKPAQAGAPALTVSLRVDADNSGDATAQTGDRGFQVDENGIPTQLVGDGNSMAATLSPLAGYAVMVDQSGDGWSAEMQIAESLVGGWDHAARIMLAVGQNGVWPLLANGDQPATWAPAYFGTSPAPAPRAPVAVAGPDLWENVAVTKTIGLDGRASFDPDGDALTYAWTQTDGPTLTLDDATSATPHFVVAPLAAPTTVHFQLVVSDATLSSAADEVTVTLLPTPRPHTPATFTPSDLPPANAGTVYLPLISR